ncbi:hypothetical protein PP707_05455 [Acetobacter pasteurianus]|nr:hypothetical protein [Acetobacter pasteurianus]
MVFLQRFIIAVVDDDDDVWRCLKKMTAMQVEACLIACYDCLSY